MVTGAGRPSPARGSRGPGLRRAGGPSRFSGLEPRPGWRPGGPPGGKEGREGGRQEGKGRAGRGSAACGDQPLPRVPPSGLRCWGLC